MGSLSWAALGLDASAMGFRDGLGYGEAEAAARLIDAVQPVEAFEYARQLRFGYARSPVCDLNAQLAGRGGGPQGYALAFRAVLDGVVYQGEYRLFHTHGVDPDEPCSRERGIEPGAVFSGEGCGPVREAAQQNPRLHGPHPERWCGRLRAGQEEQILYHPGHRR